MEYDLISFTNRLIELFGQSKYMPDMGGFYVDKNGHTQKDDVKHSKRPIPRDLRTQITNCMISTKVGSEDMTTFDLGSEIMEQYFPYYHILQQAPAIRKRGKATRSSKGSQTFVKSYAKKDYEIVRWNGKTFTKEYEKNVRGSRAKTNVSKWNSSRTYFMNESAAQYRNIHYGYIDSINDEVANLLANEFGMKLMRKKDTGYAEEYGMQYGLTEEEVLDIFSSFDESEE